MVGLQLGGFWQLQDAACFSSPLYDPQLLKSQVQEAGRKLVPVGDGQHNVTPLFHAVPRPSTNSGTSLTVRCAPQCC